MTGKLGACIAARNEAETISHLIQALQRLEFQVFVVDDASEDATRHIAVSAGAQVATNEQRLGIAGSYMKAWKMALAASCDRILQIDAGGSHFWYNCLAMLEDESNVVIGGRFMPGARYIGNPVRAMLSCLAAIMCNRVVPGANYCDWTSGYRLFNADALCTLASKPYKAKMHAWQIEVLYYAHILGMSISQRPITYVAGNSSFNFSASREAFSTWWDIRQHCGKERLR